MTNKKIYNNLFDSICITLLLLVLLSGYALLVYFGIVNYKEETNPLATFIIETVFFGFIAILIIILILHGCYEYWILFDDSIMSKKIFHKKVTIKLVDIQKVEKTIVPAIVLETFKSEAYVIHSNSKK